MINQFTKFNSQEDQNNIGLFTFYREQAEYENNINSFSLLRKNKRYNKKDNQQEQPKKVIHHPKPVFNKFRESNDQDYKRSSARQIQQQLPMSTKYIQFKSANNKNQQNEQNEQKNIKNRKILRGTKAKSHHYKQKYGNAVIVIHSKEISKQKDKQKQQNNSPQKQKQLQNKSHVQANNVQELISSKNNNKYFLHGSRDNSGLIGKIPAEKHIIDLSKYLQNKSKQYIENKKYRVPMARSFSKPQSQSLKSTEQIKKSLSHQYSQSKNPIKHSYFNKLNLSFGNNQNLQNSTNNDEQIPKYIPTFSCQKLPYIMTKKSHQHQPIFYVKKYKSKKIQDAMKSNNTEIIKQIRESLKDQLISSGRNKIIMQKNKLQINNTKQYKQLKQGEEQKQQKQQKQIMKVYIGMQKEGQPIQKKQKQPQQSTLNDKLAAKQRKIIQLLRQSNIIKG